MIWRTPCDTPRRRGRSQGPPDLFGPTPHGPAQQCRGAACGTRGTRCRSEGTTGQATDAERRGALSVSATPHRRVSTELDPLVNLFVLCSLEWKPRNGLGQVATEHRWYRRALDSGVALSWRVVRFSVGFVFGLAMLPVLWLAVMIPLRPSPGDVPMVQLSRSPGLEASRAGVTSIIWQREAETLRQTCREVCDDLEFRYGGAPRAVEVAGARVAGWTPRMTQSEEVFR